MSPQNPKVDAFFAKTIRWRDELEQLRTILLDCSLTEELKWAKPCYSYQNSLLLVLQGFKPHCVLLFAKGALLQDPDGVLLKPGEHTQAARRIVFTDVQQVIALEETIKAYIYEAIAVEQAGLKVEFKQSHALDYPEELSARLASDSVLNAFFLALTPGRQRFYGMHIAAAKQATTRLARVEKCVPLILAGKGLNDR